MSMNLGGRFANEVKPPESGQIDYFDAELKGLGLRVSAGGTKTWFVMYRHCGRRRRLTIGSSNVLNAATARRHAKKKLAEVATGSDPAAERRAAREAESFAELAALYMEKHARPNKLSWPEDQKMLDNDLLPAWRHRKAADISGATAPATEEEATTNYTNRKPRVARISLRVVKFTLFFVFFVA